jgi:putative cardiolipin synthase
VGRLLINELLDAADRGVRIRLLVDDMYGEEADDVWLTLDSHPSFEVRLFNPFVRGRSKNLQFITRFRTVNHRMHSKTYTVDNQATIVGGRNIGDEYFDADPNLAFSDVDVMAIGPVVPDVSNEFDEYWNSEHAYSISTLLGKKVEKTALDKMRQDMDTFYQQKSTSTYIDALANSEFAKELMNHSAQFNFAKAIVIHDSAEKLSKGKDWQQELLISQLAPYIKKATEEFILVSPYFVPGQRGADALCKLSEQGVKVRILTNSLVSNDVAAVHTGYMRHRKQLLRCGVQLYELNEQLKKVQGKLFTWLPGLSKSSLHAKTMAFDHKAMFVGSFNFDQRSLHINNEIGILFYEPQIASQAATNFDKNIEKVAFRVDLITDENGKESLRWTGEEDGKEIVFDDEPYASFWQKLSVNLMRVLPIDSML